MCTLIYEKLLPSCPVLCPEREIPKSPRILSYCGCHHEKAAASSRLEGFSTLGLRALESPRRTCRRRDHHHHRHQHHDRRPPRLLACRVGALKWGDRHRWTAMPGAFMSRRDQARRPRRDQARRPKAVSTAAVRSSSCGLCRALRAVRCVLRVMCCVLCVVCCVMC